MGTFYKNKIAGSIFLLLSCAFSATIFAVSAADLQATPSLPLIDGYYPAYPPTKSGDPEQTTLVQRGEYLAKMGDCISCHTNVKAGTPAYAGGLPIATPFGTFYSPNITPDEETGIGRWTEADFIRALKHGRDPDGGNYFPVFPFVYFTNTTDDDARALYAYFMSIPPVHKENRSLPFPFNVPGARFTLWGWNLLFFYPNTTYQYDATQSAAWNRGKYIVDGLGHCSMCHTPLNPLGSPKTNNYLTGAFIDGFWAPNINKAGLARVTAAEISNVFVSNELLNKAGPVAGPMAEVNHNSLKYLTEEDRLAIATYLKTVESVEPLGLPPSDEPPSLSRGKQIYLSSCVICHQDGEMSAPIIGDGANWYRRLKSSGLVGFYRHAINGFNSMPIKGACVTCSDNDVISAVNYLLDKSLSRSQRLGLSAEGAKKFPASGKVLYNENCGVCHDTGKQGAPILGDKEAWKPVLKQSMDVLVHNTIHGQNHPKQGGCKTCTTGEILDAIKYMVNKSKSDGDYSLW